MEKWNKLVLKARTKFENFKASEVEVFLSINVVGHVKTELVKTVEEESFKMEQFGVAKEQEIFAQQGFWAGSCNIDIKRIVTSWNVFNIEVETSGLEMSRSVLGRDVTDINREERAGCCWIFLSIKAIITGVNGLVAF